MTDALARDDQRSARLRALTEVSRALTYTTSIQEVLNLAVERAAQLMYADRSLIMMADDEGLLTVRAAYGVDQERVRAFREPLSETLIRRLEGLFDCSASGCFLSVPLVVQGQVTGLLAAVRPAATPGSEDDEWVLSALADQAAVALENARLLEAVQDERTERAQVAEAQGRAHATLGHELRAPLNAVQAYSALLIEGVLGPLTDRQREAVSRIRMSGEHLLAIIENVMDTARLGAGAIKLSSTDVPAPEVLSEAVKMVQPQASERRQQLRIEQADDLVVRADRHRLRQALVNLIGNAIKYTPEEGAIVVSIARTDEQGRPCAALMIRDNGRGITPAALPRIFEAYNRGEADSVEPGLGLGLFISRELIRQMGGDIRVASEPGRGSTFTVTVPLAPPQP